ncbi:hypothetical protein F5Y08DRAFT_291365 [Xylaria arbuscula]|uniref:Uncharacterized protein n=1 Tax=Xylaria arbuscula TaxID=114810 RepID=A0A9W8NLF1_9PEZI|nr:hypothetical protein F5Y08DRAFT_291365 [Xylaria arbuscula]KAJ3579105.1 hypothetical protein NPX13_g1457 [Xylaria arbuscula]
MPFQLHTPHPTLYAAKPASSSSNTTFRSLSTAPNATVSAAATQRQPGFLRRLAATPRGRVALTAVVLGGCVIDYELWTLYGAKYFTGKGQGQGQGQE